MLDVTARRKKFAQMTTRERLRHLGSSVIATKGVDDVVEACDILWDEFGCTSDGGGAFIVGETRAGKSTAVAEFADRLFDRMRKERPDANWSRPEQVGTPIRGITEVRGASGCQRPLVVVFVDPRPRFNSLMKNTAQAMGVTLKAGFTFSDAITAVKHHVDKQGIKMIIFDEVQHIARVSIAYEAADVLKVMGKAGLQVVCVGLEEALQLGQINEQLEELTAHSYVVTPLACSLDDFPELDHNGTPIQKAARPKTAYGKFIAALDSVEFPVLPFDAPSNISDPQMALRIHRATNGYVGRIMRLLLSASHLAIRRNLSKLGPKVLADAYRAKTRCNDNANWFLMDWPVFIKNRNGADPKWMDEDDTDEAETPAPPRRFRQNMLRKKR